MRGCAMSVRWLLLLPFLSPLSAAGCAALLCSAAGCGYGCVPPWWEGGTAGGWADGATANTTHQQGRSGEASIHPSAPTHSLTPDRTEAQRSVTVLTDCSLLQPDARPMYITVVPVRSCACACVCMLAVMAVVAFGERNQAGPFLVSQDASAAVQCSAAQCRNSGPGHHCSHPIRLPSSLVRSPALSFLRPFERSKRAIRSSRSAPLRPTDRTRPAAQPRHHGPHRTRTRTRTIATTHTTHHTDA